MGTSGGKKTTTGKASGGEKEESGPLFESLKKAYENLSEDISKALAENEASRRCLTILCTVFGGMMLTKVIMIPVLIQMILYTLPIIWFGSHLALNMRVEAEEDETKKDHEGETITSKNAMALPFIASSAILCL